MKSLLDNAYTNSRRSYNSDELVDAQYYAKKAMNAAEDAARAAKRSDCPKAERYAKNAYDYARKAYNSDNIDDARYYSHKSMRATEDAISEAKKCKNNRKEEQ
jgi:hypothetical protein